MERMRFILSDLDGRGNNSRAKFCGFARRFLLHSFLMDDVQRSSGEFRTPRGRLAAGLLVLGVLRVGAAFFEYTPLLPKADFNTRYNEVLCIRLGSDPFTVFRNEVHVPGFVSLADVWDRLPPWGQRLPSFGDLPLPEGSAEAEGERTGVESRMTVHVYPPWSYAFLLPFAFLPRDVAWLLFLGLELLALSAAFACGAAGVRRAAGGGAEGRTAALLFVGLALNLGKPWQALFAYGNYGGIVAGAIAGMVWCLDRRRDVVAGLFLAVAMAKPQLGLPLCIPLLLAGRRTTVFVGAAVCTAAGCVPSLLCGIPPWTLLREAFAGGGAFFSGTSFLPAAVFRAVPALLPFKKAALLGCMAAGGALCAAASLPLARAGRRTGALELLSPAILLSTCWMVSRNYDYVITILPLAVIVPLLLETGQHGWRRTMFLCAVAGLFFRNLNPVAGPKVARLTAWILGETGVDLAPVFALRTAAAEALYSAQSWFVAAAAVLLPGELAARERASRAQASDA